MDKMQFARFNSTYNRFQEDPHAPDGQSDPVRNTFFSNTNKKRLQKMVREKVYEVSDGKFIMNTDQDEKDMLVAMRFIFNEYSMNTPERPNHQVKELNNRLIREILPGIMTNIRQYYGYMKEISQPKQLIDLPVNVNSAGRNTLPSVTTLWSPHCGDG